MIIILNSLSFCAHIDILDQGKIGVDFALKVINMDPTTNVRLQLWYEKLNKGG